MATDDEEVGRFELRRGARFVETIRDQADTGTDDEWLAGLRPDSVDEPEVEGGDAGEPGGPGPPATPAGPAGPSSVADVVTTLTDAVATLEDRLALLEEALVKAVVACTVSRSLLRQLGAAARDHSRPPGDQPAAEGREP